MIDQDRLEEVISQKKSFRLGSYGISIKFWHHEPSGEWEIDISRAFTEIHATKISVVADADCYCLEMTRGAYLIGYIDLMQYDKLTVME